MKPLWLAAAAVLALVLVRRRHRLEPTLLAGGGIVVAGCLVYGLGLVELPNLETLLTDLGQALGSWTYLLVGALAFLETGAFIGLLAPGETTIIVGGVVAGQGEIDIVALIALVWACAVAGDVTSFLLGRRLGRAFLVRHGPKVQITPERLTRVEDFFARHGGAAVLVGRFVGIIRAVAPFLAGSGGMPLRRFLPYDILGAGLWGTTYCLLGYAFWRSLGTVLDVAEQGAYVLGTLIVVVVGVVWLTRFLGEAANRRRVWHWLDRQAGRPLTGPLVRPAVALLRRATPALRFLWNRLTPGGLGLEFTTLLAVVAVSAFAVAGYAITLSLPTELTAGDRRGLRWGREIETAWLTDLSEVVTQLGALPVAGTALVLAAVGLVARRQVLEALSLTAGLALTIVLVEVVQGMEGRIAPPDALTSLDDAASFPSGHAAYGVGWVAIALALRRALPNLPSRALLLSGAIVLALAIAAARIGLRVAWFSDAAGGLAAGALGFSLATAATLVVASVRHNGRRPREQ